MFLNPLLLWGLALAAVPVLIHLLSKRRFRVVRWAAMDFLLEALRQNRRRLRLRDLVLMLIRAGAVGCLALALARPTVAGRLSILGGGGRTAGVLLVDTSLSMNYNDGRETRLDAAKRLCKSILGHWEKHTWCALVTFAHDVRAPLGDPSQNLAFVEQELDQAIAPTDGHTNLAAGLLQAKRLFRTHPDFRGAGKELYILTDLQARTWDPRRAPPGFADLLSELSSEAAVVLVDVGSPDAPNAAITELAASDALLTVDMPVTLRAAVKNFGPARLAGAAVDFYVDPAGTAEDRPAERATLDVDPGETATASFEARFAAGGDHRVEARLTPTDRLAADDRRFMTLEVIEESRFLLVDGRDRRPDAAGLGGETGYLRHALSPRDPEKPEKQSVIVTEVVPRYRLAEKDLAQYQAVVLSNVERLDPAVAKALARQVHAGMGLLMFLGDLTDVGAWNAVLGEDGARLLPARIEAPWGEVPRLEDSKPPPYKTFSREPARLAHPIVTAFTEEDATELLARVKFYRAYTLRPLPGDEVQVAAWFEDRTPALVERAVGAGSVLLAAFPATTAWSNLPTQYAFPVLMQRAAGRLTLGRRPPKNVLVGAALSGLLGAGRHQSAVRLTPPPPRAHRQEVPELLADGRAAFHFAGTDRAGYYEVSFEPAAQSKPWTYSVSPDAENESDLASALPAQLRADYPRFEFTYVSKNEDLAARLAAAKRGSEMWPWLLFLVFALLALESVLALLWAPRQ